MSAISPVHPHCCHIELLPYITLDNNTSLHPQALTQPIFFTASAPLTGSHINISPKGLPAATFTIFSPNSCAYIDATGSGSETISHVYENGRVTIMFCSFDTSPRILRFFCWGKVVEWDDEGFGGWVERMGKERVEGGRAVVVLEVWKVQTSCGYGVPFLPTNSASKEDEQVKLEDRETLGHWASKHIEKKTLREYQTKNNAYSLDGLPGLRVAIRDRGESVLWARFRSWTERIGKQREAFLLGAFCFFLGLMVSNILNRFTKG